MQEGDDTSPWHSVRRTEVQLAAGKRNHSLQIRHRSCTVEPTSSPLFRLMGAALWPSTSTFLDCLRQSNDDELLKGHAENFGSLLELGSGHGLCGLACCFLPTWRTVVLTDKDTRLVDLIAWNCKANCSALSAASSLPPNLRARQLVWGHEDGIRNVRNENGGGFDVVLAVGCTYSRSLIQPLMLTIAATLRSEGSTALILHECRQDRPSIKGVNKIKRAASGGVHGYWRGSHRTDHPTLEELLDAAASCGLELAAMRSADAATDAASGVGETEQSRATWSKAAGEPAEEAREAVEGAAAEGGGVIGQSVWGAGRAVLLRLRLQGPPHAP